MRVVGKGGYEKANVTLGRGRGREREREGEREGGRVRDNKNKNKKETRTDESAASKDVCVLNDDLELYNFKDPMPTHHILLSLSVNNLIDAIQRKDGLDLR